MLRFDRRDAVKLFVGAACAAQFEPSIAAEPTLLTKKIPKTGERLPVIGVGTNNYSPTTPDEREARKKVLEALTRNGASVIDTAPAYRESERTIGELLKELGNRERAFVATKITSTEGMLEESFRRLQVNTLDLVQVHNLINVAALLPLLRAKVAEKKVRYIGVTTWTDDQYPELAQTLRRACSRSGQAISMRSSNMPMLKARCSRSTPHRGMSRISCFKKARSLWGRGR